MTYLVDMSTDLLVHSRTQLIRCFNDALIRYVLDKLTLASFSWLNTKPAFDEIDETWTAEFDESQ